MWTRKNKKDLSEKKWKRYKSRRHRAKFEQSRKINLSPRRHQKTFLQHKAGKERKKKCCFTKHLSFPPCTWLPGIKSSKFVEKKSHKRHKRFQIVRKKILENFYLAPKVWRICIGTKGFQKKCTRQMWWLSKHSQRRYFPKIWKSAKSSPPTFLVKKSRHFCHCISICNFISLKKEVFPMYLLHRLKTNCFGFKQFSRGIRTWYSAAINIWGIPRKSEQLIKFFAASRILLQLMTSRASSHQPGICHKQLALSISSNIRRFWKFG